MENLNKKCTDIAIVGAGVAGLYAAYCSLISGLSCIIFDMLPYFGGQCVSFYPNKEVYGVPGMQNITASSLVKRLSKQVFGLDKKPVVFTEKVCDIVKEKEFFLINSGKYTAKKVILATGIGNMQPSIPRNIIGAERSDGFAQYYCMKTDLYKDKFVIVAGGGDSAADFALDISRIAKKVLLIHRKDKLLCEFNKLQMIRGTSNIEIKLSENILNIENDNKVITDKNIYNNIDYIVFCYGFSTTPSSIDGIEINENGLIDVDFLTMETKNPGIYAIGDAIAYKNKKKNIVSCFYEADKAVRMINKEIGGIRDV
ncbi:MAG: NAD(P)/FAD-dependent oxidoreductase [Holosporales bacterium]|nr:NAD(P)/FAD-dependent oxidoreductase [Holosporales bacterium]